VVKGETGKLRLKKNNGIEEPYVLQSLKKNQKTLTKMVLNVKEARTGGREGALPVTAIRYNTNVGHQKCLKGQRTLKLGVPSVEFPQRDPSTRGGEEDFNSGHEKKIREE